LRCIQPTGNRQGSSTLAQLGSTIALAFTPRLAHCWLLNLLQLQINKGKNFHLLSIALNQLMLYQLCFQKSRLSFSRYFVIVTESKCCANYFYNSFYNQQNGENRIDTVRNTNDCDFDIAMSTIGKEKCLSRNALLARKNVTVSQAVPCTVICPQISNSKRTVTLRCATPKEKVVPGSVSKLSM